MTAVAQALYLLALAGFVVFVVRYLRTDWFRREHHPLGRHLMAFMLVLILQCLIAISAIRSLDCVVSPRLAWGRIVGGALLAVVVWWRTLLLFRRQANGHRSGMAT